MGFFSWECNACNHPMLSHWATNEINDWMQEVTVFLPDGERFQGTYDGYGKVTDFKEAKGKQLYSELEPMCFHTACLPDDRAPLEHKPSVNAEDQGYFFDTEHNMKKPK